MRNYEIIGLEGQCDDCGYCEPYTANEEIRQLLNKGKDLSEEDVERIALSFHCHVRWRED